MQGVRLRHFIICEDLSYNDEDNTFTAQNVYEFISAKQYPAKIEFKCAVGLYFFQPDTEYTLRVVVFQNEQLLGSWDNQAFTVDKPNEVMNFFLRAKEMTILSDGIVEFQFTVNDEIVDKQYVLAVKEG